MNKIQIVINVILVAAVATLFGLHFAGKCEKPAAEVAASSETTKVTSLMIIVPAENAEAT